MSSKQTKPRTPNVNKTIIENKTFSWLEPVKVFIMGKKTLAYYVIAVLALIKIIPNGNNKLLDRLGE